MTHSRHPFPEVALAAAAAAFLFIACAAVPPAAGGGPEGGAPAADEPPARGDPGDQAAGASRARSLRPLPGASEIGDPYYPGLGNGGYDVQHYDLVLDVEMVSGEILAEATITARALHDLASFNLDLLALGVSAVLVDGEAAAFEHVGRELAITPAAPLPSGAEFVTVVRYGGRPEVAPDPAVPFVAGVGWAIHDSGVYVLSECTGAASWFPCNDHPSDKATFSFEVTVPEPFVVAANGLLVEERSEHGWRTFVWRASDPMATYLATVNIAEFGLILEEGPRGMPLRLYHPLDATEAELAEFARTAEMMEFFEELFGPYPFECYGGVLAYEQIGGALETQTLPVYGRGCNEAVLAHEMAHQWFGNAVSPATWSEMWLNEGFASYAEFLWFEYVRGPEAAEARVQGMYRMLRARRVGPAADPGVERLFGANTYVRGGWVLHQLRRAVGDEVFFEILRTWGELHHDGVGTTEGFLELCDRVSGRELGEFLGELLYAEVVPVDPDYEEEEVEGR